MTDELEQEQKKRMGKLPKEKNPGEQEDTVTLTRGEFDSVMERLAKLENPGVISKPKRVKEHVGRLAIWEDNLVVAVGTVKERYTVSSDHPDRLTIELGVITPEGKKETVNASYVDFMRNAVRVPVKFLAMHQEKRLEVDESKGGGGVGTKLSIDKEGRLMDQSSGQEIEFEVEYVDVSAEVEVIASPSSGVFTGRKVKFSQETINAINA